MDQSFDVLDNAAGGGELTLSPGTIIFLRETRKWVNFLSILGFILIGLMVLFGLFAGAIINAIPTGFSSPAAGIGGGLFGIVYIIMALLYFFPVFYLYKFGAKLKVALTNTDNAALELAFENLKSHYKFVGILTLIIFGFYFLSLVGFGIFGAAMSL